MIEFTNVPLWPWLTLVTTLALLARVGWWVRLALRRRRGQPVGPPDVPGAPPAPARWIEAGVVLVVGAFVVLTIAAADGLWHEWRLMPWEQVRPHVYAGGIAIILTLLAAALTLRRTPTGVITMLVVVTSYAVVVDGPQALAELSDRERVLYYAITAQHEHSRASLEGVDVYVNGEHLGQTPVVMPLTRFIERVPYRAEPPEGFEEEPQSSGRVTYSQSGQSQAAAGEWFRITLHRERLRQQFPELDFEPEERSYYVRLRLGDEWAVFEQRAGEEHVTGGSGGGNILGTTTRLPAYFPDRAQRLEKLLDRARLADYDVGDAWLEQIETYSDDGWLALRNLLDDEPGMAKVLDAWAWHITGVGADPTPRQAWEGYLRVCRRVDQQHYYDTDSVEGRALELLTPYLDPEQVADDAEHMLRVRDRSSFSSSWSWWPQAGAPGDWGFRLSRPTWQRSPLPASTFASRHAVRLMHQHLETQGQQPTLMQERVTPALIRHGNLREATWLGGPAIETYLLRQDWQARNVDHDPNLFGGHIGGGRSVNRWFMRLANLDGDAGRRFRHEQRRRLREIALPPLHEPVFSFRSYMEHMQFLFLDLDEEAEEALAHEVWAIALEQEWGTNDHWNYLLRMGEHATPRMYVEGYLAGINERIPGAVRYFPRFDEMSQGRAREVYEAMVDLLENDLERVLERTRRTSVFGEQWEQSFREGSLLRDLERSWERSMGRTPEQLHRMMLQGANQREALANWFAYEQPNHEAVDLLVEADDPEIRRLTVRVLRAHPTPTNRDHLARLAEDDAPTVRQAAAEARQAHQQLVDLPWSAFAAKQPRD